MAEIQKINVPTQVSGAMAKNEPGVAILKLNEGLRLLQDQINRMADFVNNHERVINGTEEADYS